MNHSRNTLSLPNPFPGLRAFEAAEHQLFFGRSRQINGILHKLRDVHFVSVVGNSGSGKSSLIKAGVLPGLAAGFETVYGSEWEVRSMRPGLQPLQNLADTLGHDSLAVLQQSEMGLLQVVRQHFPKTKNLLLLVDQFEEMFRDGVEHAEHFVRLLTEITRQPGLPLYVIITLRSDFVGDCATFEGLPEAINNGQYLVPRLSREDLREAITGPVAVAGGKISPRLVQHLLAEINYDQDELPLLQHVMMRSWDIWIRSGNTADPLDLEHYRATGGIASALSNHATEALNELSPERQLLASRLFKALTTKTADNRGVRRPTRLNTLAAIANCTAGEAATTLEVFRQNGRAFVIPSGEMPLTDNTVVDISHESLMRTWDLLRAWVDEEAESAELYGRLSKSALLHRQGQAALWRDPELQLALDWKDRENPNLDWAAQLNPHFEQATTFLAESVEAARREHRSAAARRRVVRVAALVLLAALSGLSFWAWMEQQNAKKSAAEALIEKNKATLQEQAAKASEQDARQNALIAEEERRKAENESIEAGRQRKLAEQNAQAAFYQKLLAEQATRIATDARKVSEREREKALQQKQLADKMRQEAENSAISVKRLRNIDVAKRLAVKSLQLQKGSDPQLKALLAMQAYQFTVKNGGFVFNNDLYNALHKANLMLGADADLVLRGHTDLVRAVAFSPDGKWLATAGSDGRVIVWEMASRKAVHTYLSVSKATFARCTFSPEGRWLACGTDAGQLLLFDVQKSDFQPVTYIARGKCLGIVFKDNWVCSIGEAGIVTWELSTGKQIFASAISLKLFAGSLKDEAWVSARSAESELVSVLLTGESSPRAVSPIHPKTTTVCMRVANQEPVCGLKTGFLFTAGQLFEGHADAAVQELCFNHDQSYLATASYDGTLKIWLASSFTQQPITFDDHDAWVLCCTYSADGKWLASGGRDKAVRLFNTSAAALYAELKKKLKRQLTHDEWNNYIGNDIEFEILP